MTTHRGISPEIPQAKDLRGEAPGNPPGERSALQLLALTIDWSGVTKGGQNWFLENLHPAILRRLRGEEPRDEEEADFGETLERILEIWRAENPPPGSPDSPS